MTGVPSRANRARPRPGSAGTGSPGIGSPSTDSPVHGTHEYRPASRREDAFLSGNGRHGTLAFGDPYDDRVIVTHHTLVRPKGSEHARPPELAAGLTAPQDRSPAGEWAAADDFTDHGTLQWGQPFHPAFRTRLRGAPSDEPRRHRLPGAPTAPGPCRGRTAVTASKSGLPPTTKTHSRSTSSPEKTTSSPRGRDDSPLRKRSSPHPWKGHPWQHAP